MFLQAPFLVPDLKEGRGGEEPALLPDLRRFPKPIDQCAARFLISCRHSGQQQHRTKGFPVKSPLDGFLPLSDLCTPDHQLRSGYRVSCFPRDLSGLLHIRNLDECGFSLHRSVNIGH